MSGKRGEKNEQDEDDEGIKTAAGPKKTETKGEEEV